MPKKFSSLRIQGFRAIDDLSINGLSDINLIVGKNSTGKTTLLEAILLISSRDIRHRIYNLLAEREEYSIRRWESTKKYGNNPPSDLAFEALFSGRPDLLQACQFRIAGRHNEAALNVKCVWLRVDQRDDASIRYIPVNTFDNEIDTVPGLEIDREDGAIIRIPFDRFNRVMTRRLMRDPADSGAIFLPSSGMTMDDIGRMWDSVALTDDEDDVIDALRIISPDLEKLVMIQSPETRSERMLMAKVEKFHAPVPFKSLGEGAIHLLSTALALIKARGSILLIDEVANGIHYTVQTALWEMIFRQAARFNIQVFATTHSWDCVKALRAADNTISSVSASLVRLEKKHRGLRAITFSSSELQIVDDEEIEVR